MWQKNCVFYVDTCYKLATMYVYLIKPGNGIGIRSGLVMLIGTQLCNILNRVSYPKYRRLKTYNVAATFATAFARSNVHYARWTLPNANPTPLSQRPITGV